MMLSAEETGALRPEEKDAILDAMLGMAWSDGSVAPEEIELMKEIAGHFTDRDVEGLIKDYKVDNARVARKIASSDLGGPGKRMLIRVMAFVAAAEGTVEEKELAFYRGCLRSFGVQGPTQQRIEREVRREVYTEMLTKQMAKNELDEAAKAKLDEMRKRFEIDDATVAEIEKQVKAKLGVK
ncbi:MAG TPA: hypothetical protein VHF22_05225 [Planctomycetota bacterium]|nr:hypothetical protein [Planctomycetota bacterium]